RDELRGLLDAYRAKAGRLGAAEDAALDASYRHAHDLLWTAPCDLAAASAAVTGYQQAVLRLGRGGGRTCRRLAGNAPSRGGTAASEVGTAQCAGSRQRRRPSPRAQPQTQPPAVRAAEARAPAGARAAARAPAARRPAADERGPLAAVPPGAASAPG